MTMTSQFVDMTSSTGCFFYDTVTLLSSLVTGPSLMSILVLSLWQFSYKWLTRNLELEIPFSEFCPVSGDWGQLGIGLSDITQWLLKLIVDSDFCIEKIDSYLIAS